MAESRLGKRLHWRIFVAIIVPFLLIYIGFIGVFCIFGINDGINWLKNKKKEVAFTFYRKTTS